MRGTFALVIVAGVAAAAGWSLVRQAGESADDPASDPAADPPPDRQARFDPPEPVPVRETANVAQRPLAAEDAASPAKALTGLLAGGPDALADASARTRALALAGKLVTDAATASSRNATESRLLARRAFAAIYDCEESGAAERTTAYDRSRELLDVLVRGNGAPDDLVLRHTVAPGESVWALAKGAWKRGGISAAPGFVLWMNGVQDARRIRAGQILKVPREPVSILVRKRTFELTVLLGGAPVERFPVAVGSDARTPAGVFQAKDCLKNPDWYMNGRKIPFGSPDHIIGTRWIGLSGAPVADGIGIHGTTDEASIGTAASLGCVRMRNTDVERIFEWIATGTRVEIRE